MVSYTCAMCSVPHDNFCIWNTRYNLKMSIFSGDVTTLVCFAIFAPFVEYPF